MRMRLSRFISVLLMGFFIHGPNAFAGEKATKEDAVAFLNKAIAYVKENGKEKAFTEFNNSKGKFVENELYIVVVDFNGVILANGYNQKLNGKNLLDMKDVNGKPFVREEIEIAKTKGKGWLDFVWNNPHTQKMEPRSDYLERVDDYFILTGVYGK